MKTKARTQRSTATWVVRIALVTFLGYAMLCGLFDTLEGLSAQKTSFSEAHVVRADGVFFHPDLHFSVPDPGQTFVEFNDSRIAQMNVHGRSKSWSYVDKDAGQVLQMTLFSREAQGSLSFEAHMKSYVKGMEGAIDREIDLFEVDGSEKRGRVYVRSGVTHMRADFFKLDSGEVLVVATASHFTDRFETLAQEVVIP